VNQLSSSAHKDIYKLTPPADIAPSALETIIFYCFMGYISALTYYSLLLLDAAAAELVDKAGGPVVDEAGGPVVDKAGGSVVDKAGGPVVDEAGGSVVDKAGGPVLYEAGRPVVSVVDTAEDK